MKKSKFIALVDTFLYKKGSYLTIEDGYLHDEDYSFMVRTGSSVYLVLCKTLEST
jgi:hypothetical protein